MDQPTRQRARTFLASAWLLASCGVADEPAPHGSAPPWTGWCACPLEPWAAVLQSGPIALADEPGAFPLVLLQDGTYEGMLWSHCYTDAPYRDQLGQWQGCLAEFSLGELDAKIGPGINGSITFYPSFPGADDAPGRFRATLYESDTGWALEP